MLGCVMKFKAIGQPSGFFRLTGLVERGGRMGVEVIHHDHNFLCLGIDHIRKVLHGVRPIFSGALVGDFDKAHSHQRLKEHKQVCDPFPLGFVILSLGLTRLNRNGVSQIGQQLFTGFIHTHLRSVWIIWLGIHLQNVFHVTDKGCAGLGRNAPFFFQPRLKFVFLSVVRMVSCETLSTISNFTKRSRNSRKLQRSYPSGASLHASAIKWASAFPSKQCSYSRSGFLRLRACSNPPAAYALRTLVTVSELTSNASQMAS